MLRPRQRGENRPCICAKTAVVTHDGQDMITAIRVCASRITQRIPTQATDMMRMPSRSLYEGIIRFQLADQSIRPRMNMSALADPPCKAIHHIARTISMRRRPLRHSRLPDLSAGSDKTNQGTYMNKYVVFFKQIVVTGGLWVCGSGRSDMSSPPPLS